MDLASAASKSEWITNHSSIDGDSRYVVFAIGARADKSTYLYHPEILSGWQFKQRIPGCYAAMPMPEWIGV